MTNQSEVAGQKRLIVACRCRYIRASIDQRVGVGSHRGDTYSVVHAGRGHLDTKRIGNSEIESVSRIRRDNYLSSAAGGPSRRNRVGDLSISRRKAVGPASLNGKGQNGIAIFLRN